MASEDPTSTVSSSDGNTLVPNHLASLVPSFDPSRDDLVAYTQKVQLLTGMWPDNKWTELATRLILNTTGSAFMKLQLQQAELTRNERKSIQRIVEVLGGHWGQINLEKQYEFAERALYRCVQKQDETSESFLARADVMWSQLIAKGVKLEDLQPYVTLRGSQLSADDKKRVLLDVDASGTGKLSNDKVNAAIRMLGAGFFHDVTGSKKSRGKVYDQSVLVADGTDFDDPVRTLATDTHEEINEEECTEILYQEGDEDAALVTEFEQTAADVLQNDEDLASALNSYTEARRRLSEKFRFRGFWPATPSKGKGKGKSQKGKGKGTSRKTLQQRILESRCRICGKMGHWKAECPQRQSSASSQGGSSQALTSFVQTEGHHHDQPLDGLPLEFLELPVSMPTVDDTCIGINLFCDSNPNSRVRLREILHKQRNQGVNHFGNPNCPPRNESIEATTHRLSRRNHPNLPEVSQESNHSSPHAVYFASHGSHGIVDLGATKTVIGSQLVADLIRNLNPDLQSKISRCACNLTFRFGNQGLLHSEYALVVPIQGCRLKIAVVPGATPFLLSNTLLRTLGAVIDTQNQILEAKAIGQSFPLQLSSKGLFLIDINDLASVKSGQDSVDGAVETHAACESKTTEVSADSCISSPNEIEVPFPCFRGRSKEGNLHNLKEPVMSDFIDLSCEPSSGSKKFAQTYRVPSKPQHVVGPSSSACATEGASRDASLGQSLIAPVGVSGHRFRKDSCGKDLPGSLGKGATVGDVVRPALSQFHQEESPRLSALRQSQGGKGRIDWRASDGGSIRDRSGGQPIHNWKGEWQVLTKGQSQGHGSSSQGLSQDRTCPGIRGSDSGRPGARRDGPLRDGGCPSTGCESPGATHVAPRDSPYPCDPTSGKPGSQDHRVSRSMNSGDPDDDQLLTVAGDLSNECEDISLSHPHGNIERKKFQDLVEQISSELDSCVISSDKVNGQTTLFEVYCGSQSQLTHQCQQLGFRAIRFDRSQGDLSTSSGRKHLFDTLIQSRPKHLWFAPTCGPWSSWSNLNGNRSVAAWDALHQSRSEHLRQIALGVVLLRFQISQGRHFHWEQPRGSMMFRLPYLSEVFHYMIATTFDMCVAGSLKDPQNGKLMKKPMIVATTMKSLSLLLNKYQCPGNHDHQQIEGSTTLKGESIQRSSFSENYTRKFARLIVRHLCKVRKPVEPPIQLPPSSESFDILVGEEQGNKRRRVTQQAKPKLSRVLDVPQVPWGKRQRCVSKTTPLNAKEAWESIFADVNQILPRVGRITIGNGDVLSRIDQLFPDKSVRILVVCRGSSRTMPPPPTLTKGEAPFRKTVFQERDNHSLKVEADWEEWENLSQRQLVRPTHASHISITVFACNPEINNPLPEESTPHMRTSHEPCRSTNSVPSDIERNGDGIPETTQEIDAKSPQQVESFRSLPPEERNMIARAHKNLGHPNPERFSTILRQQGFRPAIIRAALDFKCSTCQATSRPKIARPCTLRDDLDFNDRICADGFRWTNHAGKSFHVMHIVDWSTSFQTACIAPSRTTEDTINNIINMWLSWAGSPGEMLVDAGTEYNSEGFGNFAQQYNISVTTVSPEAHYQNGKAERHGAILQHMLSKFDLEHPISSYQDLQQALWWIVQSKNACSLKRGYAPEVLVLGKHTKLPGSVCSDEMLPSHLLADSQSAHGIKFRQQLAYRETARKAFHDADNDMAIRRAVLRRSRPTGQQYSPGEWVMVWREGKGALDGSWLGPMKVVVHENQNTIWTTMCSKLYRTAPESIRPVTAVEAHKIQWTPNEPSTSQIAEQIRNIQGQGTTQTVDLQLPPNPPSAIPENLGSEEHPSTGDLGSQPDGEPEAPPSDPPVTPEGISHQGSMILPEVNPSDGIEIPVPDSEEELICDSLQCVDIEPNAFEGSTCDLAWRCEILVTEADIEQWKSESDPEEMIFVASAAKRQRSEIKLSTLTSKEKEEFDQAKHSEIQNWIRTGTISRILRHKIPPEQILRCRWILTWKPVDEGEPTQPLGKKQKNKARLVILGYLDPQLEQLPRDSPTLGKNSKMLLLQMISSRGWTLRSFDIKAAFLQGKPQQGRILGVEPVPELIQALQLQTNEICKLEKGAYGLVDAPFLWYTAILEELLRLGFTQSPFDPCVFVLRHPTTKVPEGILGLHVDDGICGGNQRFDEVISALEKKYPFGSKKTQSFTFTGIEMFQHPNKSISLSQSSYVRAIEPIKISPERRKQGESTVTDDERQALRGLIGSLQYAAVHTRPDLSSRLSFLQSDINRATVDTLIQGNQTLHEAKRHHDVSITIQAINTDDLRFLAFSDASFASKGNPSSHTGIIIMATHRKISDNEMCLVSPLSWGCRKIQRVVTSTLAAETVSLGSTLDQLSWIRLCWAWMMDPSTQWKKPGETLKSLPESYSTATYRSQNLPDSVAATDCKSLYDLVTRTAPPQCSEFRTQLAARAIKDMLAEGTELRWVHSGAQLADSLTKIMESSFLRETLRLGKYRLHDELKVLKSRANSRNRLKWLKSTDDPLCNDASVS